jgi:PAS domain S-box-containing protein
MHKDKHVDGKKLISELESLLDEIHRYSDTINQYVITSSSDLQGKITSVSQAFCQISGYEEHELIGQNHSLLRHPDMPSELYQDLWKTIQSGKTWEGEVKNKKKNGDAYWVNVHIDPIVDESDEITGYLAVRQDITDHKYIESLTVTDELNRCSQSTLLQSSSST